METHRRHLTAVRHALAGVAVALLVFSCAPGYTAPPVSAQLAKASPTPQSRLERGYQVHQAKCAKCHPFEDPADYAVDELTHEIMPEMARKSKLEPADAQAVLAYLLAARKLPPPLKEG
jgi:mono/diheme cytochrome c family protein